MTTGLEAVVWALACASPSSKWASFPRTPTFWHLLHCCLFLSPVFSKAFTLCVFTDVYFPHVRDKEPGGLSLLSWLGGQEGLWDAQNIPPHPQGGPRCRGWLRSLFQVPNPGPNQVPPFCLDTDYQVLSLEGQPVN